MSEQKHTKGPWTWIDGEGSELGAIMSGQKTICDFGNREQYYPTEGSEPSLPDRNIMVAAPDLLEALKGLCRYNECWYIDSEDCATARREKPCQHCIAIAAIAKAEGFSPDASEATQPSSTPIE